MTIACQGFRNPGTLLSPSPSAEAPRSPCRIPVRGTGSRRTESLQSCPASSAAEGPAAAALPGPERRQAQPGPVGGGVDSVEDCPGLAFPCSLKECCTNGPLFGLVFYPPGVLELPGFSQACLLLKGGKDLGDGPRPGVARGAPIPHLRYRAEVWRSCHPAGGLCCCWGLCKKKGVDVCLLHPNSLWVLFPEAAELGVPAGSWRGKVLEEISDGFPGTEDRIHVGQRGCGTDRAVRASLLLPRDPLLSVLSVFLPSKVRRCH